MHELDRARWIDTSRGRRLLLVGFVDVALLVTLVTIGVVQHGTNPLTEPVATLETVVPFVIAWLPIAVLAGLYTRETLGSPMRAVRFTTVGWLAAANVGLIIRSSGLFEGGGGWPFNLVLTGLGLLVFVSWRGLVGAVSQ